MLTVTLILKHQHEDLLPTDDLLTWLLTKVPIRTEMINAAGHVRESVLARHRTELYLGFRPEQGGRRLGWFATCYAEQFDRMSIRFFLGDMVYDPELNNTLDREAASIAPSAEDL